MVYRLVFSCLLTCLCFTQTNGQTSTTIDATDTGWYDDSGFHNVANTNYITGTIVDLQGNKTFHRSFASFDLSSYSGRLESAVMRLFLPAGGGYLSADPSEIFSLFDFSGNIDDLLDGNGGIAAYSDLGDGASFGSQVVSDADKNDFVEVMINPVGLAAIEASMGGRVVIGGALTSIDNSATTSEWVFGLSGDPLPSLVLTTIPEPSGVMAFAVLLGVFGIRKRH